MRKITLLVLLLFLISSSYLHAAIGPAYPSGGGGGGSTVVGISDVRIISVDTSSSPQTVTIQSSDIATDNILFIIKDESDNASINNITIGTQGSEKIDVTLDSVVINADSGSLLIYSRNGNLFSW